MRKQEVIKKVKDVPDWKKRAAMRRIRIAMIVVASLIAAALIAGICVISYQIRNADSVEWKWLTDLFGIEVGSSSSESSEMSDVSSALTDETDFRLMLFSVSQPGDASYVPNLSEVDGVQVDSRISEDLSVMIAAAKQAGITLHATAGYVSYADQQSRYEQKVQELVGQGETKVSAENTAKKLVPPGGCSDFQTGLCVTFSYTGTKQEYRWILENGADYGFVIRYPDGKKSSTGMEFSSNTVRYVGPEHAKRMRQLQMCLEEYLSYLLKK